MPFQEVLVLVKENSSFLSLFALFSLKALRFEWKDEACRLDIILKIRSKADSKVMPYRDMLNAKGFEIIIRKTDSY